MKLKINDFESEIPSAYLENDFFVIDHGAIQLTIANNDGELSVYKAISGRGENVYSEYKDAKVELI